MLYSLAESCYIHYILEARSFRAFLLQPRTTTHHGPVGRQQLHAPVPDLVALVPETNKHVLWRCYGAVLKKMTYPIISIHIPNFDGYHCYHLQSPFEMATKMVRMRYPGIPHFRRNSYQTDNIQQLWELNQQPMIVGGSIRSSSIQCWCHQV